MKSPIPPIMRYQNFQEQRSQKANYRDFSNLADFLCICSFRPDDNTASMFWYHQLQDELSSVSVKRRLKNLNFEIGDQSSTHKTSNVGETYR